MTDFVGSGWAFPPSLSARGTVALVSGLDELEAALRMILCTAPGERVMRPDFGCAAWDHVFDPVDGNSMGLIEQAVSEAVRRWEPRVEVLDVRAFPVGDAVHVDLTYQVRASNDRRNLVYPFYAISREEAP
jgi:uncharacterized protein